MSNTPMGNEAAMAKVREMRALKEKADTVNQGDKATNVVAVNFTAESGKVYEGKFEFKRPNVMESLRMGGRKSQLLQEAGVVSMDLTDSGVLFMAQCVSTLEVVAVKCPEWFLDMSKLEDADVIFHVYGQYTAWDYSFRLHGSSVQKEDSEHAAGTEDVETT